MELCMDPDRLLATPVDQFTDLFAAESPEGSSVESPESRV
jgi:hypothetical protein